MILIGSNRFFKGLEGFEPHDIDYLELVDNPTDFKYSYQLTGQGKCYFKWKRMSADEFVEYSLNNGIPMQVGKFLVPEFNKEIGFTLEHLKKLEPVFNKLDMKHTYEKIIYDSYIENGGFFLTNEQRMKAFNEYKESRVQYEIYKKELIESKKKPYKATEIVNKKGRFVCGSRSFFEGMEGFQPHDTDYLEFVNKRYEEGKSPFVHKHIKENGKGCCLFQWITATADEYIEIFKKDKHAYDLSMVLTPGVAKHIGFTIDHLKQLEFIKNNLSFRFGYYKVIYDSYIENNDFVLTDEQRMKAFNTYLEYKNRK